MLITQQNLDLVFRGFKTLYRESFEQAPVHFDKVAMTVPSTSRDETYGWIGQFPTLREWIGPRHVQNLAASTFTIRNRKFESTVEVDRDDISDDKLGLFKPVFQEMGLVARQHPDQLVSQLLAAGFAANCYDGQFFFDTDHPVLNALGEVVPVSNVQAGAGAPWFLLDTSRALRPLIFQERETYEFQALDKPNEDIVFMTDKYLYGVRARVNAGFGFWQFAFGSRDTLNAASYASARAAMQGFRGDGGRPLGVVPTLLVVPPTLEDAARRLLNGENGAGGETNPWKGTAELVVTPHVAPF